MRRSTGSPTGRYQAACGDGHCALQGGAGRSKLQGQIFTLLDLALGPGISDAPVATAIGRVNVDMLFRLGSGNIVVEYDGAYFHQHRARTDRIKADALRGRSKLLPAHVLRIREQPLPRLHHHNVLAPPRPTPQQCAQLALLHMLHTLSRSLPGDVLAELEPRIQAFLQAGKQIAPELIACLMCRHLQPALQSDFRDRWCYGGPTEFRYREVLRRARRELLVASEPD